MTERYLINQKQFFLNNENPEILFLRAENNKNICWSTCSQQPTFPLHNANSYKKYISTFHQLNNFTT